MFLKKTALLGLLSISFCVNGMEPRELFGGRDQELDQGNLDILLSAVEDEERESKFKGDPNSTHNLLVQALQCPDIYLYNLIQLIEACNDLNELSYDGQEVLYPLEAALESSKKTMSYKNNLIVTILIMSGARVDMIRENLKDQIFLIFSSNEHHDVFRYLAYQRICSDLSCRGLSERIVCAALKKLATSCEEPLFTPESALLEAAKPNIHENAAKRKSCRKNPFPKRLLIQGSNIGENV